MDWPSAHLIAAGKSLIFLFLAFALLERAFPIRSEQRFLRPHWWTDLSFFVGQYLLWTPAVHICLDPLFRFPQLTGLLKPLQDSFHGLHAGWKFALLIFLSDLSIYWGHRAQHRWSFLWRFHSVHHTSEYLDWMAAHREHPIDTLFTATCLNLPFFLLDASPAQLAAVIAFRGMWSIYIHSNAILPLGPLKYLIGGPEFHHWHHVPDPKAGNFANVSPLMDLLFGTHVDPGHFPEKYGLSEGTSHNYLNLLWQPLQFHHSKENATSWRPKATKIQRINFPGN